MKPERRIEKFLRRIDVIGDAERKRLRLEELLEVRDKIQKPTSADAQPAIRSIIMNSRMTRLAAIAVIVMIGVFAAITQLKDSTGRTNDIGRQENRTTSTAGGLSLAQRVARSSAIVRATLEEVTDECSRWRIKRVLFGDVERVTVDLSDFPVRVAGRIQFIQDWKHTIENGIGRNLTTEEMWKEFHRIYPDWPALGKEVILFLEEQGVGYSYQGAAYDVPAISALDDFEERLLSVIESGEHKSVSGGDIGRL